MKTKESTLYTIAKRFTFSASHQLHGLPEDHPCSRLHGHNYTVELELQAVALDDVGFVLDYRALNGFKTMLDGDYDHRHLNDVLRHNPTAENLAVELYFDASRSFADSRYWVSAVRVSETDKTWAEYRPTTTPTEPPIDAVAARRSFLRRLRATPWLTP